MMKILLTLFVLLFAYPNTAISELVQVPFLFTEDEELETIEFGEILQDKSNAISTDEYLNEPLTKLDFVLMKMNEKMEEHIERMERVYLKEGYDEDFETIIDPDYNKHSYFPKLSGSVWFNQEKGKIIVHIFLESTGKPRKPLNKICKDLTGWFFPTFPQRPELDYVYQYYL